jgi:hypothetical protein
MFTMFVFKKSPKMIKIKSKKLGLIMRLNKTTYPNSIFKIFKLKMLITMLGWKMQMRFKVMMNKNNTSFLEGGSVICKEQSIVADRVLFIEDKLTSLNLIMLEIKHHPLMKNLNGMMTMLLFLMMQNT